MLVMEVSYKPAVCLFDLSDIDRLDGPWAATIFDAWLVMQHRSSALQDLTDPTIHARYKALYTSSTISLFRSLLIHSVIQFFEIHCCFDHINASTIPPVRHRRARRAVDGNIDGLFCAPRPAGSDICRVAECSTDVICGCWDGVHRISGWPRLVSIVRRRPCPGRPDGSRQHCGAVWRVSPGLRMWTASGAMCRHDSNCDASCLVPLRLASQTRNVREY